MRPGDGGGRVLIVAIDDGLFGIHLDWVEDVLQAGAASLHGVRNGSGRARPFVLRGRLSALTHRVGDATGQGHRQEIAGEIPGEIPCRRGTYVSKRHHCDLGSEEEWEPPSVSCLGVGAGIRRLT